MHECSPRPRRQPAFGSGVRGEWAAWLPLLFVGAMMFWTVALGLGGWSLMVVSDGTADAVGPAPTATEPMPGVEAQIEAQPEAHPSTDRITVQVEESREPEDVNDNPGSAAAPTVFDRAGAEP